MKFAIAAIFKNEVESILEWVAYHRVVGFDYFIVANNDSTDGTRELLDVLQRLGVLSLIDFPSVDAVRPQLPAYLEILKRCPKDIDVLGFIDADEFIVPMDGARSVVPALTDIFADNSISALALNWGIFGSSGHLFKDDGTVIERFQRRASQPFNINCHYKTFVRPGHVLAFDNPHHVSLRFGRYVDEMAADVVWHPKFGRGLSETVSWERLRINHYAVKSLEEFLVGKSKKGSASKANRVKHKKYFFSHDRNDEECSIAAQLADEVRVEMLALESRIAEQAQRDSTRSRGLLAGTAKWFRGRLSRATRSTE